MAYVYLIGTGIVASFWLIFYIFRYDLRKKILLTSIIGGILGFTEIFFVPNYWNPQFQVIRIFDNLFLDSLLFAFFLAGFSSVIYQFIFRSPLFKVDKIKTKLLLIPPIIFLLHLFISEINVMVFSFGSMLIGAFIFYFSDKKLGKPMLLNGLFTFIFFMIMYIIFWQLFPLLIISYNYEVLSGINIFRIPIEELLFFFAIGTNFCLIYEILENSKLKNTLTIFKHNIHNKIKNKKDP
ncbi:MAG: hypothetical protein GQ477_04035 [Nanohaloarchaea archaeon]|nr:hypothetical protein [Candidatus Nanohaloarchaea archaeon]